MNMKRMPPSAAPTLFVVIGALVVIACACVCARSPARAPIVGGDAARGAVVIAGAGCGACHAIPGVRGARGVVGPPLDGFAERAFIAGEVPNAPEELVRFLINPRAVEPNIAMPALGLDAQQARDVAAYLYTLR